LKNLFNRGYQIIKVNGTYDKIYKKWFGETITSNVIFIKRILIVLGALFILAVIIVLFILRWNTALKKEVQKRTNQLSLVNKQLVYQKEQLENNDKFKAEILNSLLSGIVTLDRNKIITFINFRGTDILNISERDILGKNIDQTVLSNFFTQLKLDKVLSGGNHYRGQEIEITCDEDVKTFNCNLYPLKEKNNNIYGAILNFRDISEEKKIKAELARKDRMQALGLMIAGLAHEIRNPLTSIKFLVDLIPYKLDNQNFRKKFMEIVPDEINRLSSLITDLLEYSKPKGFFRELADVKEIFYNINMLFSKHFKDKNIYLSMDIDDDLKIYADKHQVKQVFINLILNSIEAIESGGNIHVIGRKSNQFALITIEDEGTGISKENLEKIMDPFFTTKSYGTGLGLFICYQIILENEGYINVESRLQKGTKVMIKLPSQMIRSVNNEQHFDY
jgi:polar amino acid transport system substrate-binding protein